MTELTDLPNLHRAGVPYTDQVAAALAWQTSTPLVQAEFAHQVATATDPAAAAAACRALADGTLADQVDQLDAGEGDGEAAALVGVLDPPADPAADETAESPARARKPRITS